MVKVSVIIPVYNGDTYLRDAIESVKTQTFTDWEIIAVDDGSRDQSQSILRAYERDLPGAFRLISQANQGISVARNRAIGISSGEYIALLDSDDVWFPEKLELQVKVLGAKEAAGMVYSDCTVVDSDGCLLRGTYVPQPPPQGMIFRDLILSNCIPSSSAMMRKNVLQETGLFNPAYRIAMDYDLWLRLAVRYPIEAVQKPLMQYRLHMGGISSNRAEMIREDLEIMEKWLQEKPNLRIEMSEGILQKQRTFHYHLFLHHLHSMEPWKASRSFLSWLALGFHRTPGRRSEVR